MHNTKYYMFLHVVVLFCHVLSLFISSLFILIAMRFCDKLQQLLRFLTDYVVIGTDISITLPLSRIVDLSPDSSGNPGSSHSSV